MKHALMLVLIGTLSAVPAIAADDVICSGGTVERTFPLGKRDLFGHAQVAGILSDYSNVSTSLGATVLNGGATLVGSNTITRVLMDDLTPNGANAGQPIVHFKVSLVNTNGVAVRCRPRLRFWNANGAGGNPGTYISGFSLATMTIAAGTGIIYSNFLIGGSPMPATTIWAGVTFDDVNGTTGATAAQLNGMGVGVFGPVDAGSSADTYFLTTLAGDFTGIPNPAGAQGNFGGNPVANFGWELSTDAPVSVQPTNWSTIKGLYR